MDRITYKKVKGWIGSWNENHPEVQFELSVYSGFYHLFQNGENVITEETPRKLWEAFGYWKSGYFKGLENGQKLQN